MIFDDHDVHDDWNISEAWIAQMRAKPWWEERILGAYTSYWIYQHLGNLSPSALFDDPIFCAVQDAEGDCEELVRDFARTAAREIAGARWSYLPRLRAHAAGGRRLARRPRPGRRPPPDAVRRRMGLGRAPLHGDFDHLVVGTSLPFMLAPGMHHLEAWNEAVCDGAWGRLAARAGERIRQALDLEHWAAFQGCFARLSVLLEDVAAGRRGPRAGDDHRCCRATFTTPTSRRRGFPGRPGHEPRPAGDVLAGAQPAGQARAAGAAIGVHPARRRVRATHGARRRGRPQPIRWAFAQEPTFDNQIARLDLRGRDAQLCIEKTLPEDWQAPRLHTSLSLGIAPKR